MFVFWKIWRDLFPSYLSFETHPLILLLMMYSIKSLSTAASVSCIKYKYVRCYVCMLSLLRSISSYKISPYDKNTKKRNVFVLSFFL